jgi:hypothetical protein
MNYGQILDSAQKRKSELLNRHQQIQDETKRLSNEDEQIKRELIGLDQIIEGVELVSGDGLPDLEPMGFTDNIRKILTDTRTPLVPTQIRDALQERGISGSSPKNLLINVHKVLERIAPELTTIITADGKSAYVHKRKNLPDSSQRPVVDLMAALKESLAKMESKKNAEEQQRNTLGEFYLGDKQKEKAKK